jgi:hypothetical protein
LFGFLMGELELPRFGRRDAFLGSLAQASGQGSSQPLGHFIGRLSDTGSGFGEPAQIVDGRLNWRGEFPLTN